MSQSNAELTLDLDARVNGRKVARARGEEAGYGQAQRHLPAWPSIHKDPIPGAVSMVLDVGQSTAKGYSDDPLTASFFLAGFLTGFHRFYLETCEGHETPVSGSA